MSVSVEGVYVIENPSNSVLASAKVIIDGKVSFFVNVVKGKNGLFASLPQFWSKTKNDGKGGYENAIYLSEEVREEMNTNVIAEYENKKLAKASSTKPVPNKTPVPSSDRVADDFEDDIPF